MVFAKNLGKNLGKNVSRNLSGKYGQKRLDHAKKSATDKHPTSSKRVIQKRAEATGDLIGNKIANKTAKLSKNSEQNNTETVTDEHQKEILEEKYVSPGEKQEIVDKLRLN